MAPKQTSSSSLHILKCMALVWFLKTHANILSPSLQSLQLSFHSSRIVLHTSLNQMSSWSLMWALMYGSAMVVWIPTVRHPPGSKLQHYHHNTNCHHHPSAPYHFQSGEPSSSSSLKRSDLWLSEYPSYVIILASWCTVKTTKSFTCNCSSNKFVWWKRCICIV